MPAQLEAPTAPAPAAPAAPAAAAPPAKPAAPEPAPGGAQGARPAPAGTIPPKLQSFSDRPESAKSKAMERLRQKVAGNDPKAKAEPKPEPQDDTEYPDDDALPAPDPDDIADGDDLLGTPKTPKTEAKVEPKTEKKKVNPWKLIDEHKATKATMDREIAELKKMIGDPEARKSEVAELEKLRAANKELLDKIRYVEYQSHPEFTEKYEAPYRDSWKVAMKNLQGITVGDEDGMGGREIVAQDILELVNMPNAKARVAANERFGDFADDVMRERDKIRTAYDNRESALEKARTEGSAKIEAEKKARYEAFSSMNAKVKAQYDQANEKFSKRKDMAEFFQDIDGDDDANEMLKRGYQLVDEAFSKDVLADGLSDEERASIVKKHAAVRHRAAAFGRARHLLAMERAAHEVTKAKLAEFTSTVPNRGVSPKPSVASSNMGGSKMQQMMERLRSKAK